MNIRLQHRITSLLMAFLMLFSSVGFSMDIHYCGDEIESIGFFSDAPECEMMEKKECLSTKKETHSCCPSHTKDTKKVMSCHSEGEQAKSKSCCHNEKIQMNTSSDIIITNDINVENLDFTFTAVFILINQNVIAVATESNNNNPLYSPPLITEDIAVLHQVFII